MDGTSKAPEAQMSALDVERQKKTKLLTVAPIATPEIVDSLKLAG